MEALTLQRKLAEEKRQQEEKVAQAAAQARAAEMEAKRKAARDAELAAAHAAASSALALPATRASAAQESTATQKKPKKSLNIMDRLEDCERGGKRELDISLLGLPAWPVDIGIFPKLHRLLAFGNKFTSVSPLSAFSALEVLDLSRNAITDISTLALASLSQLKSLDLSRNAIVTIPPEIGELKSLEILNVHRNLLVTFPVEVAALKSLITLNAEYNDLRDIGDIFENLPKLTNLNLLQNPNLVVDSLSLKTKRLVERRHLMVSKSGRHNMIQRALGMKNAVRAKEQLYNQLSRPSNKESKVGLSSVTMKASTMNMRSEVPSVPPATASTSSGALMSKSGAVHSRRK